MRKHIPSSSSLKVFEAAARHGNFARAAEELSLTEGAVSRQIARLESFLNRKLFDRIGSRVKLNPVGEHYAQNIRETLDRLDRETQFIKGLPEGSKSLNISSLPTFSSRWLIPRLGRFRDKHPDITVNISVKTDPYILAESGFDAAIHFEHPAWIGTHRQFLFQENLIPVCNPLILGKSKAPNQLTNIPLIHRQQNPEAWDNYAKENGIILNYPFQGARYELHEMAISAAIAGLGVALVPSIYVEKELNEGSLIAPWPESKILSKKFCLIKSVETSRHESTLSAFEDWLDTEIHKFNITKHST
ncbi:LysR substrate-binding domain-containing protein [Acinetobacter populi]|uniref:LysR family transcriptional regulator n=1 Tax=Acinetobacter populi TaxID=1582270 RepID=A0A1Z9YUY9_9GAMM|nr:LysR substrate-binding domain-containing protein [Acinetobacter populi]OUY05959.1 LysR family transcriptional regulator [Acinetobacter populi]